jgi:hypothetical protein
VGDVEFTFPYEVPPYLPLLFDPNSYFVEWETDDGADDGNPAALGYRASASEALARLERVGLGRDRLALLYETYKSDLLSGYLSLLEYEFLTGPDRPTEVEAQQLIGKHIGNFATSNPVNDIDEFAKYLGYVLGQKGGAALLGSPSKLVDRLHESVKDLPPPVATVAGLFDDERSRRYEELAFLLYLGAVLTQVDPHAEVRLEVQEVVDWDVAEGRQVFAEALSELTKKLELYEKLLRPAIGRGSVVQTRAARDALKSAIIAAKTATEATTKGESLENLAQALFSLDPGFRIKRVRANLGDEELDLIIANDGPSGFWSSLQSPLILVECKNWSGAVGAPEIRDFESKVRNHRGFSRLGIFIAANGFTSEAEDVIKRLSRDETMIVLLALLQIEKFAQSDQELTEWLEDQIATLL